jgi:hypothetical protein
MNKKQKLINFIEENIEDGDSLILYGYILTQNKNINQTIKMPEKKFIKEYVELKYDDSLFFINEDDQIKINSWKTVINLEV